MGYVRKKSKKKRIKHLNADSERETMKENEIRKIEMDCSNCNLIIIRKDKKKIIVDIRADIMSIQREQDLETSDLPDDLGDTREYWPRSYIHIFITEKDRESNEIFEDTKLLIRSSTLKKGNNAMTKKKKKTRTNNDL